MTDKTQLKRHTKAKHKAAKPLEADPDDELTRPALKAPYRELMAFRQAILQAREESKVCKETKREEEKRKQYFTDRKGRSSTIWPGKCAPSCAWLGDFWKLARLTT